MPYRIRRADYFYTTVKNEPGEACGLLSQLADLGINLLAFTAVPVGPVRTQLSLFPEDSDKLSVEAERASIVLDGPHPALLVQGDDELGALADIHRRLAEADVNVFASSGVTDGHGSFGYVLYLRPDNYEQALAILGL
jgi:hypothetical protein